MGIDSRLTWFGKASEDQINFIRGRNTNSIGGNHLLIISEDEYNDERHNNVRKYFTPVEVKWTEIDFDAIKRHLGVGENEKLWGMGNNYISYGNNYEDQTKYAINWYDEKWKIEVTGIKYCCNVEEIWYFTNRSKQRIFKEWMDKKYPDCFDEYSKDYEIVYAGYYEVTKEMNDKIKEIYDWEYDKYDFVDGLENCYYSADW